MRCDAVQVSVVPSARRQDGKAVRQQAVVAHLLKDSLHTDDLGGLKPCARIHGYGTAYTAFPFSYIYQKTIRRKPS
ncbi:hypothetical protein E4U60_001641 [Claviceps pazoutovae]|uniref:Uncharacterized protein n=1 Tax=Claviceps pazoutovae TaxID=1649127 RepID=A0A9P7SJW4_9HYPO|nr:hypothetical protein E4U60_001641 [Claviceps pazoutovae]